MLSVEGPVKYDRPVKILKLIELPGSSIVRQTSLPYSVLAHTHFEVFNGMWTNLWSFFLFSSNSPSQCKVVAEYVIHFLPKPLNPATTANIWRQSLFSDYCSSYTIVTIHKDLGLHAAVVQQWLTYRMIYFHSVCSLKKICSSSLAVLAKD
jgi:hypothetical protein